LVQPGAAEAVKAAEAVEVGYLHRVMFRPVKDQRRQEIRQEIRQRRVSRRFLVMIRSLPVRQTPF
jgi:hypothetical protein